MQRIVRNNPSHAPVTFVHPAHHPPRTRVTLTEALRGFGPAGARSKRAPNFVPDKIVVSADVQDAQVSRFQDEKERRKYPKPSCPAICVPAQNSCWGTSDFGCLRGSVDGTSVCRRRTPESMPDSLRDPTSSVLVFGLIEGAENCVYC